MRHCLRFSEGSRRQFRHRVAVMVTVRDVKRHADLHVAVLVQILEAHLKLHLKSKFTYASVTQWRNTFLVIVKKSPSTLFVSREVHWKYRSASTYTSFYEKGTRISVDLSLPRPHGNGKLDLSPNKSRQIPTVITVTPSHTAIDDTAMSFPSSTFSNFATLPPSVTDARNGKLEMWQSV